MNAQKYLETILDIREVVILTKSSGIKAIVERVVKKAKHGPYAIAKAAGIEGTITFSLDQTVWKEASWPEPSVSVYLDDLEERRAGWRAKSSRLWKPTDKQDLESKQPTESARKENDEVQ